MATARKVASKAKASTKRAAKKKTAPKKKAAPRKKTAAARVTLASIAAQLSALSTDVAILTGLLRGQPTLAEPPCETPIDESAFEPELLAVIGRLDRSGRHAGMIPIPEIRQAFLERGWTRIAFDDRLLQAERDFLVDLKTANDPSRLVHPHLAIEERGRGHLQYVVQR